MIFQVVQPWPALLTLLVLAPLEIIGLDIGGFKPCRSCTLGGARKEGSNKRTGDWHGDRKRVVRDVLSLLTVEHLKGGPREEGLKVTGRKDDWLEGLSSIFLGCEAEGH